MSRLSCLLAISLSLVTVACSSDGDTCGPGGAPTTGLVATNADGSTKLTFGDLHAGLNNDCPASDAPAGVVSLTVQGTQSDAGTQGFITLCIARPDLLAKQAQDLQLDVAGAEAKLVDASGTASNCSLQIDPAQPATGTVSASGLCASGGDPAGFALVVDGALHLQRTCNTAVDSIAVTLRGRVAVSSDARDRRP
jgi:hypothetical protein